MSFSNILDRIPVLLCFDANYANYAAVASYSAQKNTQTPLIFYWLTTAESRDRAEKLKDHLHGFGMEIRLLTVDLFQISQWKTGYHFTSANYLRLFAPDLLSEEKKVIYIDCDTIVLTDLRDLYDTPLADSFFAGVVDEFGGVASKVPFAPEDKYINSGVLLMDVNRLRNDGFFERVVVLYQQYEYQITLADQCLINKYAEGKKLLLDPKWNRQLFARDLKEEEFMKFTNTQNSSILHFFGEVKPWHSSCSPCIAKLWWEYASQLEIPDLQPIQLAL